MSDKMPDVQEMDMKYERYYLVPWSDCQKFEDLDPDYYYIIPAYIHGNPICFVPIEWVGDNYE